MQANFGYPSWFCKFFLWAVWSRSSVRGMTNIVKSSKCYRLTLQWTTLVSTKIKYSLHCGAVSAAATICEGTYKTFLICSDSKQKNKDAIASFSFPLYDQHVPPTKSFNSEVIWSDGLSSKFKNKLYYVPY